MSFENHEKWCESIECAATVSDYDIVIDFVPASVTGGLGTNSFQDAYLNHPNITASTAGIRFQGDANVVNLAFVQPTIFPDADGAVGIGFASGNCSMQQTTLVSRKSRTTAGTTTPSASRRTLRRTRPCCFGRGS
ncbi:hypothetical protein PNP85_05415 [Halobacterium salinarum]|uniref:hypothetical protein n=1 Tax=Halobacterium salinarum TaxID=2242 RepID=UPI002553E071|nr:hypothetical protein [Halobacterium salinarum]MDL0138939.1 hypothetical protein [Halobacterium salinarum]